MSEILEVEINSMTKEQNYMRGYKDGKLDVLYEIRAEIEEERKGYPPSADEYKTINKVLQIIDKYKTESEDKG